MLVFPLFSVNPVKRKNKILYLFLFVLFFFCIALVSHGADRDCTYYADSIISDGHEYSLEQYEKTLDEIILKKHFKCLKKRGIFASSPLINRPDVFFLASIQEKDYEKAQKVILSHKDRYPSKYEYYTFLSFIMFLDLHELFYKRSDIFAKEAIKKGILLLRSNPHSDYSVFFKKYYFALYDSVAYSIMKKATYLHKDKKYIPALILYREIVEDYSFSTYAGKAADYLQLIEQSFGI